MKDVVWALVALVATLTASFAIAVLVLIKLPEGYFLDSHHHGWWRDRHPILRWTGLVAKNVVGAALVIAGAAMLLGPGPGVAAVLVGLMLLDFPGKGRVARSVVRRPRILSAINRLRARFGRPPLVVQEGQAQRLR
jgi:hypothetical protein